MTYKQLIAHYETMAQAAAALSIDRQVVYGWGQRDNIPLEKQLDYELATGGVLKADLSDEMRKVLAA